MRSVFLNVPVSRTPIRHLVPKADLLNLQRGCRLRSVMWTISDAELVHPDEVAELP